MFPHQQNGKTFISFTVFIIFSLNRKNNCHERDYQTCVFVVIEVAQFHYEEYYIVVCMLFQIEYICI
jgi:hypothetical protein